MSYDPRKYTDILNLIPMGTRYSKVYLISKKILCSVDILSEPLGQLT